MFKESSPVTTRKAPNRHSIVDTIIAQATENDTQKQQIHPAENEEGTKWMLFNPNPPPRKDKNEDSSRHSSGMNNAVVGDIDDSISSQPSFASQAGNASNNNQSNGSSAHTYANPLRFLYL